jgi:hypothetical protein
LILAKILDADWRTVAAISVMAGFLFIAAGSPRQSVALLSAQQR